MGIRSCLMRSRPRSNPVRVYVTNFHLKGALDSGKDIAEKIYRVRSNGLINIARARGVFGATSNTRAEGSSNATRALSAGDLISVGV